MWCTLAKYSCMAGSPTIERELSFHGVHSPGVLGHTLVRASVLLLKIWDFQDAAGFPHVHFPGEGHPVHSPPVYRGHWAVRREKFNPLKSKLFIFVNDLLFISGPNLPQSEK